MSGQRWERMAGFFTHVRSVPVSGDSDEILLPGEIEYRNEQQRRRDGIPLPAAVYEQLARLGRDSNRSLEDD